MKYLIAFFIFTSLIFVSKEAHAIVKIDSVYADSIYSTFGTITNLQSILHKPDSQFCTLSGTGPTIDLQFRKFSGPFIQVIKPTSTILVWGRKDTGVDSSAGQITFWYDDGNNAYDTQAEPITLNDGLNIIPVPGKAFTYIELSLAQDEHGKGAKSYSIDAVALVQDTATPASVGGHSVYQNALLSYPNPFISQTTIRFALQTEGQAQLSIIDALGREVDRVDAGYLSTGIHDIPLAISSPGFYFIRLFVNGQFVGRPLKITSR